MSDLSQVENVIVTDVQAAAATVTNWFGEFESFLAHNGSSAAQGAVSDASKGVQAAVLEIEAAIEPVAADIVNYALSKIPQSNALSAAGVALLKVVATKIEGLLLPAAK